MAVAIHVKTESSDDYVFAFDGQPSHAEVNQKLKELMGDEFDYICSCHYDATFESKEEFKLDRNEEDYNE